MIFVLYLKVKAQNLANTDNKNDEWLAFLLHGEQTGEDERR